MIRAVSGAFDTGSNDLPIKAFNKVDFLQKEAEHAEPIKAWTSMEETLVSQSFLTFCNLERMVTSSYQLDGRGLPASKEKDKSSFHDYGKKGSPHSSTKFCDFVMLHARQNFSLRIKIVGRTQEYSMDSKASTRE